MSVEMDAATSVDWYIYGCASVYGGYHTICCLFPGFYRITVIII